MSGCNLLQLILVMTDRITSCINSENKGEGREQTKIFEKNKRLNLSFAILASKICILLSLDICKVGQIRYFWLVMYYVIMSHHAPYICSLWPVYLC